MAEDPAPNPNPYVDSQNVAFEQAFGKLTGSKPLTAFPITEQRRIFDEYQAHPPNPAIKVECLCISTTFGDVKTFIYRPKGKEGHLPTIFHLHGGVFVVGSAKSYEPFLEDLVLRTGFAAVFPEYTLAPDKQYPAQQEQCLGVIDYVFKNGDDLGLNTKQIALSSDSAGGQLSLAVCILNHQRALHLPIVHQILLSPFVDLSSVTSTFSGFQFQDGPVLTTALITEGLDAYIPQVSDRTDVLASPALMTQTQLRSYVPPTTLITTEADWLRDEGEQFAVKLQQSGVECAFLRAGASTHDVAVFKGARDSPTAKAVMALAAAKLREVLEDEKAVEPEK